MIHKTQETFFPVPAFLLFRSVGIDISDQTIRYAELAYKKKQLTVARHGMVALSPGIITGGIIHDQEKVIEVLRTFARKEGISRVRVSLPEEQVYTFRLHLPVIAHTDIMDTIALQLEEHVPIKATETVFDYAVLAYHNDAVDVQVTAVSKEIIDSYITVFTRAEMTPIAFEVETQSIARAVVKEGDSGAVMIVDFGETRTSISVVLDGVVLFGTTIDMGGDLITASIEKAFSIPFAEAEKIKREQGLLHTDTSSESFQIILNSTSVLRDEISKNYLYWNTYTDDKGRPRPLIKEIILCGGNANLIGLPEYLSASLHVSARLADPWANINTLDSYIPPIEHNDSLGYACALGLALADFEYD